MIVIACLLLYYLQAVNGKLYVIGGWRKFRFLDDVEEYDPFLNQWTIKSKMPQPLAYFGSVVKNGQIYVVGRISGFRPIVTSIILCGYIHLIKMLGQTYNIQ